MTAFDTFAAMPHRGRPPVEPANPSVLAANVLDLMGQKGWTRAELMRRTGLSRQTIYSLLRSRYKSSDVTTLERLAEAFGVGIDRLRSPHLVRSSLAPAVKAFMESPWFADMQPSEVEIEWLKGLPDAIWHGHAPTARTVARILEWHRSSRGDS